MLRKILRASHVTEALRFNRTDGTKPAAFSLSSVFNPQKIVNKHPSIRLLPGILLLLLCSPAYATMYHFDTALSGAAESPANASPAIGDANVFYDDVAQTMRVVVNFSGLTAGATASHIHAATAAPNTGTAGVATQTPTFAGFPTGATAGSYDHIFNMTVASSFNASFITANGGSTTSASAALLAAMLAEKSYLNIHTSTFPGGEIRGFLHVSVPDTGATVGLLGMGLGALAGIARLRKARA